MESREKDNAKPVKKTKKIDREWSPEQTDILKKWGEAAACYRYMHNHAYLVFKRKNYNFSLPVIVWSKNGIKTAGFWSRWLLWSKPSMKEAKTLMSKKFGIRFI